MPRLVLASQSPARLATLRSAGLDPVVCVSDVDEPAVLADAAARFGELEPAQAVLVLAKAKAENVATRLGAGAGGGVGEDSGGGKEPESECRADDLVLGCDSMLELGGRAYGKPADADEARRRWRAMRGRTGLLHTGHWLIDLRPAGVGGTGATLGDVSSTRVSFAELSDAEVDAYVATGEPLAVAGAFTIDGLGGPFVEGIEGDHHGVVGVSLPLLRRLVLEVGVSWPTMWHTD